MPIVKPMPISEEDLEDREFNVRDYLVTHEGEEYVASFANDPETGTRDVIVSPGDDVGIGNLITDPIILRPVLQAVESMHDERFDRVVTFVGCACEESLTREELYS